MELSILFHTVPLLVTAWRIRIPALPEP